MATPILARTMTNEYRVLIDDVVTAIRRAGAVRFDVPAIATGQITPETYAWLCRIAEQAVARIDRNTLTLAKAGAVHDVLQDDEDLVTLGQFARSAIDAYEARVR